MGVVSEEVFFFFREGRGANCGFWGRVLKAFRRLSPSMREFDQVIRGLRIFQTD